MNKQTPSKIEPIRLTPEHSYPGLVLLVSIILFAAALEMVLQGIVEAWFLVGLFGLAIFASSLTILPGACYLEVNEKGLKVVSRFRETDYLWSQIERIGIFEVGIVRRIGIDLNKSYRGPERVPDYMKSASGYHVTLPLMKGLELEELLAILERCLKAEPEATTSEPESP